MTVTAAPTRARRKKAPRQPSRVAPVVLRKPVTLDDIDRLHDLARKLDGRPVPGVRMTEDEFEHWCDEDVKAEWVDGEVILMSPENFESVDLGGWLNGILRCFVDFHDLGVVIGREFTVRLPRQRRRRVPDLQFVAKARLAVVRPTYVQGPPDLIIEMVSPDSQSRDWRTKFREYERAGVREYWVIDPHSQRVEAYALGTNRKYRVIDEADDRIASAVLPGFYLRPSWLRRAKLPRVSQVLRELGVK